MLMYLFFASLWLGLMTLSTEARWQAQFANAPEPIKRWYATQHNKRGEWCCDKADGHDFYGGYSLDQDGGVEFGANGVHHKIPDYMVLDGPNPIGHAVWWYVDESDGMHQDYCFALGAGG